MSEQRQQAGDDPAKPMTAPRYGALTREHGRRGSVFHDIRLKGWRVIPCYHRRRRGQMQCRGVDEATILTRGNGDLIHGIPRGPGNERRRR